MLRRPRRLRASKAIRNLVRETKVNVEDLIYPLFVVEGENIKEEIKNTLNIQLGENVIQNIYFTNIVVQ